MIEFLLERTFSLSEILLFLGIPRNSPVLLGQPVNLSTEL